MCTRLSSMLQAFPCNISRINRSLVGRMLYEFHRIQNGQKPSSVHATYLLYGEKLENQPSADEDVEMSSSPPGEVPEALSEPTRALTLTLVQEDKLKGK